MASHGISDSKSYEDGGSGKAVGYVEAAMDDGGLGNRQLNEDATMAATAEHNMAFKDAIRKHYKAVLWSMIISMSIVMEGE